MSGECRSCHSAFAVLRWGAAGSRRSRRNKSGWASFTLAGMPRRFQLLTTCTLVFSVLASCVTPPSSEMSALSAFNDGGAIGAHGTPFVEYINCPLIRSSESPGMTPWQVIEEALARRRPRRNMKWLADELNESIQTVSNWKARGVPFRRFREIANVLGLTVDQIEGLEALPWEKEDDGPTFLSPDVADIAMQIEGLTREQRELFVLPVVRSAIAAAQKAAKRQAGNAGEANSHGRPPKTARDS